MHVEHLFAGLRKLSWSCSHSKTRRQHTEVAKWKSKDPFQILDNEEKVVCGVCGKRFGGKYCLESANKHQK